MKGQNKVRLWNIGEDGEVYSAHSEDEVKEYLIQLVGEEDASQAIKDCFEEIPESELDLEFRYHDDDTGITGTTTWRKLIERYPIVPMQIATWYL